MLTIELLYNKPHIIVFLIIVEKYFENGDEKRGCMTELTN